MRFSSPLPSPVSNLFNYLGLAAFFVGLWISREQGYDGVRAALISAGAYAVVILTLEVIFLRTPLRESVGLDYARRDVNPIRALTKLLGLYGSYGFVALLYWLFPEYHGSYYNSFWEALRMLLPYVLILALPYMLFMDARMKEPLDGYYYFGRLLLLRPEGVKWGIILQHVLGWVVKGFFLPLMFVSFSGNMRILTNADIAQRTQDFTSFFQFSLDLLFTVDLISAVVGYACAIRLLDTHLRSSEPTLAGWFICLLCYQPFLSTYINLYLAYSPNNWNSAFQEYPNFRVVWGSTALFFLACYTLASINFGCRFSNLTHRGVLTRGMYRFTKHPAYVCKNIFWWMLHVPFVPMVSWQESLRFSLLLLGVSTVYYFRARTEERHLSRDPAYVRYALYMNEHSIFRGLAQWVPFLRYKAPAGWENFPENYQGIKTLPAPYAYRF